MTPSSSTDDISVTVYAKGRERFIYIYADSKASEMPKVLAQQALNPDLDFSWLDATRVIRQMPLRECRGK